LDSPPKPSPSRISGLLLVLAATATWGSSGIFIFKIINQSSLSAVGLAFWRDLFSTILLLAGILIFKPELLKVKKKDLPWLFGMGVISIGAFHIFWNQSVLRLGASLATMIQCNAPIIVSILARIFYKEPLSLRKILAILAAVGGTILAAGLVSGVEWNFDSRGIGVALLSALTYGSLSLFGKKLTADYNPWTITFYIFAVGTVTILIFQGGSPDPWPAGSGVLGWVLGFVLMSTILGFGLYIRALKILPASVASITATTEILFAVILANIFLGERLQGWQILGGLLIVLGVILVSLKNNQSML
jgi:drug/metabolite transporter (DMT)-like permease